MKYFVDCIVEDGSWKHGSIAMPQSDAEEVADSLRREHPDWLVEINPIDTHES